MLDEEAENLFE